jgi:hypothetical protein
MPRPPSVAWLLRVILVLVAEVDHLRPYQDRPGNEKEARMNVYDMQRYMDAGQ